MKVETDAVFSRFLKVSRDDAEVTLTGRSFHTRALATRKSRRKVVIWLRVCWLCDTADDISLKEAADYLVSQCYWMISTVIITHWCNKYKTRKTAASMPDCHVFHWFITSLQRMLSYIYMASIQITDMASCATAAATVKDLLSSAMSTKPSRILCTYSKLILNVYTVKLHVGLKVIQSHW